MDIKVESIVIDPKIVERSKGVDIVLVQSYADDMKSFQPTLRKGIIAMRC